MNNQFIARVNARYRIASANRALARHTENLAISKVLTPQHLRSLSTEQILAGRRDDETFSREHVEFSLSALRKVNCLIEHALKRYGESNLPQILKFLSRTIQGEIRTLTLQEEKRKERQFLPLYQSAAMTLSLATWVPGKWTDWHDHSCEHLAFMVVEGGVYEKRYERQRITTLYRSSGNVYTGNPGTPHRVGGGSGISLHAYSPCLEQMTRFVEIPSTDFDFESRLHAVPD